jgi:hypothetical protein
MVATTAFRNGVLFFFSPPAAFQDAANQFVFLAIDELQVIVRKLCQLLFQLSPGDIPVSFRCKHAHKFFGFIVSTLRLGAIRIRSANSVPPIA